MFDIKPIPIVKNEKSKVKIPSPLPDCHTLFVAPTKSGKSTLILNMIIRDKFKYNKYFKDIYYISPTLKYDDNFQILQGYRPSKTKKKAEIHPITDFDSLTDELEKILSHIRGLNDNKNRLIILDDCIHLINNSKIMQQLLTSGRHHKFTIWITTQNFRKINKTIRINCLSFIIFRTTMSDLKTVVEDISEDNFDLFIEKYKKATGVPYGFLLINTRDDDDRKYISSFKEYI